MQVKISRKLEEKYSKWGLKINYDKTEYLSTDTSDNKLIIIQITQDYKYF